MGVGTLGTYSANTGYQIDLGKLCENPRALKFDNLPGVIYQLYEPIKKVMVHRNGKLILWGAKNMEDIHLAFKLMKNKMAEYSLLSKHDYSHEMEGTN